MSNNISNKHNTKNDQIKSDISNNIFNIHYQKRKNTELFTSLEKIANVSKLQNYIPIYSQFFSLTLQNYNNINLNNKWYVNDIYSNYGFID